MNHLTTETRNIQTMHLDEMNLSDALKTMNQEDQLVPKAIEPVIPNLTKVIESAIQRFNNGGRIIYIGAGTSGRLGVLDAENVFQLLTFHQMILLESSLVDKKL